MNIFFTSHINTNTSLINKQLNINTTSPSCGNPSPPYVIKVSDIFIELPGIVKLKVFFVIVRWMFIGILMIMLAAKMKNPTL